MSRALSTIAARRTTLARFFAATLIALAITPFTAPFATIDAADLAGTHGGETSTLKLAKDATLTGFIVPLAPSCPWSAVSGALLDERPVARAILALVLRI